MQDIANENHIPNFLTVLTEALSNCQSVPVGPFARGTTAHQKIRHCIHGLIETANRFIKSAPYKFEYHMYAWHSCKTRSKLNNKN